MRKIIRKLFIFMMVGAIFSCSLFHSKNINNETASVSNRTVIGEEKFLPSKLPPLATNGDELLRSHVPMFVTFGWDDNAYADAIAWSVDMVANKTNHAGTGQAITYDGTPLTFSYYNIGVNSQNPATLQSWKRAYNAGHEIGNHTYSHIVSDHYSKQQWIEEIDRCNDVLTAAYPRGVGVPLNEIAGFRAPQLNYSSALLRVLKEKNLYDCSIEEGFEYDQDGTNYFWPYTLDNGSPGHRLFVDWGLKMPIENIPGLWEFPIYAVIVPPELRHSMSVRQDYFDAANGKITGYDHNLWYEFKMTKSEMLATLKHTLDLRLKGNRVPMMLGTHTDMYSSRYGHTVAASLTERREAMEEFLAYAQSKSVVRIVSIKKILEWMKSPVHFKDLPSHTITAYAGASGTIEPEGSTTAYDCSTVSFVIKPDKGYMVDTITAGANPVEYFMGTAIVGPVESSSTLEVTFKEMPEREAFQGTYYWTYNPADEPVDMTTPMVDMLDSNNNVLATVPEALAKRIAKEGSGFLPEPDGRLLDRYNNKDWPDAIFTVCDPDVVPWGYSAFGEPLVPYKTLAVDPDVIPIGSDVYVEEFDGLKVPDGNGGYFIHDGWWKASDISRSYSGYQIDFFVATYPNYQELNELLNQISVFKVYCEDYIPHKFVYIRASANMPDAIKPSGSIKVAVGKGEKFDLLSGRGNTIKEVLVNDVPVIYNTEDNTLKVENVIKDTTVHLVIESAHVTITTKITNGTITPTQTVEIGSDVVIEFFPDQPDYILEYVKIDGKEVPVATSPYLLPGVTEDHTFEVMYKPSRYFIIETIKSGTGSGRIDPSQTVPGGSNVTINFEADQGSYVELVIVNGNPLDPTPEGFYEFDNVTADQAIEVVFSEILYPLTIDSFTISSDWGSHFGANGVIKNIGTESVYGWKVTITFSKEVEVIGWNGNYSMDGRVLTITNASWNGIIHPGRTVSFGFNVSYTGEEPVIEDINVEPN